MDYVSITDGVLDLVDTSTTTNAYNNKSIVLYQGTDGYATIAKVGYREQTNYDGGLQDPESNKDENGNSISVSRSPAEPNFDFTLMQSGIDELGLLLGYDKETSADNGITWLDNDTELTDFAGIYWARRESDSLSDPKNFLLLFSHLTRSGGAQIQFGQEDTNLEVSFMPLYDLVDGFDVKIGSDNS